MTELLTKLFIKDDGDANNSRHKYGLMAGIVGICCNILLAVVKVITGILTHSVTIVSDAVNNASDSLSSIVTLIGFKITGKPADKEHPYGHGRAEYITGFVISSAVIAIALNLFKESVSNIFDPKKLDVSITTIVILSVSILIKLWMSLFYSKIARKISSEAMRATANDSRADCLTTSVALISVVVMLIWNINIDGYAGAVVSLIVVYSGFRSAQETIEPLLGKAPDEGKIKEIEDICDGFEEIIGVHDIMIHEYGHDVAIASLHVEMPYTLSLVKAHEIVDRAERRIVTNGIATEVSIHIDPVMTDDEEMIELRRKIAELYAKVDKRIEIHDFHLIRSEDHDRIVFEISVPYDLEMSDEDIRKDIGSIVNARPVPVRLSLKIVRK